MEALVSPIVDIISCLWPYCGRHTRYLCKLQENKNLLKNAMDDLKNMKNDVVRKVVEAEADPSEPKKRTDQVSGWFQSVETIDGEVEVILQKGVALLNRACLGGCCPPNICWSSYKLGRSITKKIPLVNDLKVQRSDFQELTYRLPPPSVQDLNLVSTVGMESMFEKVWRLITSTDDKPVRIMGIYGPGGVGKTTLLEKINNGFSKSCGEHDFDHVMFVVVSKPINYEAIQKKIGDRLGLSFREDGDESRDESKRAEKIFNQLRNKSFVILLDDIWERVDLQRIGIPMASPPPTQGNSSKVIFTTRSKEVCGLMEATPKFQFQVECLPWDKAWSLFEEKVGNETLYSHHPGILESAEHVARECGGLPLALITIGRAMSTKKSVEEWKYALTTLKNSASEFPGMGDKILPRLKLSYDYLGDETIKSCFLYCALYPEDHPIRVPKLIEYWIGEGFLNGGGFENLDDTRNHGHNVVETLKRVCLLESHEVENHVKLHDIIRDLALWIVNDCKINSSSSTTDNKFLVASNVCEKWRNAERIFWTIDGLEEPPTSTNLRTLLLRHNISDLEKTNVQFSLPQSFFQFTPFLRVLDISKIELAELPTSICQLSVLQYLNLSDTNIKELPFELRKLVKLKFLDLSDAKELGTIPPGVIANFSELQVLKLAGSGFKDWGLKKDEDGDGGLVSLGELDRLKQLKEVTLNISTSLVLEELLCYQKLRRVCIALVLKSCVNLKSISLLSLGNLTSLKYLDIYSCEELEELILFINAEGGETNTTPTTSAPAGLPIFNNNKLERLYLKHLHRLNNIVWEKYHHYMAAAQQQHLHYASPFQNLYSIDIQDCKALKNLTWVVYVENLENLNVNRCNGLETIIEEGASGGGRVFRRLKTLKMLNLPKLKSICSHALAFPSIVTIRISGCPEMKKLPLDSCSNFKNTLQVIKGTTKWWNELQWEDETIKSKFHPYLNKDY